MKYLLFFAFLFLSIKGILAQGDLMIYPTRIVFDGAQNKVQIINLSNTGKDTTTYRLSYVENRMTEDGQLQMIEEPDAEQNIASPFLRFYPRTITLAPNEKQVVKIQLVKTNELRHGEYRSHLYFRPLPKPEKFSVTKQNQPSEGMSIELKPIYGVTIANIVLIGDPLSKIEISDLRIEQVKDKAPHISMEFHRSGEASTYGDVSVEYISPQGESILVSESKGFAVYTPGILRKAKFKLKISKGIDYSKGKIIVRYISQNPAKTVLDEATLQL